MSIQTTANLTNSIDTRYAQSYIKSALARRIYDQLAIAVGIG